MTTTALPIVEIFHSIQGEGTRVGEPATFIRLAGCNLRCTWCDTPYSWSREGIAAARKMTLTELASSVTESSVVITGGEPMLHGRHLPALIDELRLAGVHHVTVETNATLFDPALAPHVDLWSLSPKLPASGEPFPTASLASFLQAFHARELAGDVQLKFVCADAQSDWSAMWEELAQIDVDLLTGVPILVQPDGTRADYDQAVRELAEHVVADQAVDALGLPRRRRVRVVPQIHRVAWGPAARGV